MNALPETPCNIILGRFLARIRKYFLRIIIFHHIAHIEEGCLVTDTRGLLHVVGDNNDGIFFLQLMNQLFYLAVEIGSNAEAGSSISSTEGDTAMARAIHNRCC